jgi:hypothetical protein
MSSDGRTATTTERTTELNRSSEASQCCWEFVAQPRARWEHEQVELTPNVLARIT